MPFFHWFSKQIYRNSVKLRLRSLQKFPKISRMMFGSLCSIDTINDYLFISGFVPVNKDNLHKLGITLVVDATRLPARTHDIQGVEFLKINVEDSETADLKPHFDKVSKVIKETREKNPNSKILVHCAAGISRSATLCIVHLMRDEKMTLRDAYKTVHAKRSIISPNNGFWRQMIEYEKELTGKNTVRMVKTKFREFPDVCLP